MNDSIICAKETERECACVCVCVDSSELPNHNK